MLNTRFIFICFIILSPYHIIASFLNLHYLHYLILLKLNIHHGFRNHRNLPKLVLFEISW